VGQAVLVVVVSGRTVVAYFKYEGAAKGDMREECRGQTEPLAALVAVTTFALALALFGTYAVGVLDQTQGDSLVEEATLDQVWEDIDTERAYDPTTELNESIDIESIPQGHTVYVNVTRVSENGTIETVDEAMFFENGSVTSPAPIAEPPESAAVASRPIPIYGTDGGDRQYGDIRGARLYVVVWN